MIHAINLHYQIEDSVILKDVDLCIRRGFITGILGVNGAGKSTLLRILSGSLAPSKGTVSLDGTPIRNFGRKSLARRRAWMPQRSRGGELLTVRQYVEIGRYCHEYATPEQHNTAVRSALAQFRLEAMSERYMSTLSGGERQRCDWAMIWAQTNLHRDAKGKILMLDEPTAALDWGQAQRTFDIMETARDRGSTVLVVLHDLNLARLYCDEVIVLANSKAELFGDPHEVLTPKSVHKCFGARVTMDASGEFLLPMKGDAERQKSHRAQEEEDQAHSQLSPG